ncbi:DUF3025 domain-containing protein [Caldimonas brevitalea]|uniref:Transmembrane protein n=1 Tax=Caldimonas brevitalea TaxID=413882 RepID=A0A0G3BEX4_9BURK|nr:DUF3025 domain-containing protein [Caldimonas brevitalea]AKJ27842.1 transmembrane protein [Caldimonas brevitalea]
MRATVAPPLSRAGLHDALAAIDWSRPWLDPYRVRGQRVAGRIQAGASVAKALNAEALHGPVPSLAAGPLQFVPQADLPAGIPYEAHIAATARVPTRDNLHDFFNGLVWWSEPGLKRRLNELQAAQIARAGGVGAHRGAVRDALTLFDENAALMSAPADVCELLRQRRWHPLFVERRDVWRRVRLRLFGHALLEKLVTPRKAITAHVFLSPPDTSPHLDAELLAAKPFWPLPVLGVPGWWPDNETAGFYDDPQVFRPLPEQSLATDRIIAM